MKKSGLLLLGLLIALPQWGEAQSVPGFKVTTFASIPGARGVSTDDAGNIYTMGRDDGKVYGISPDGDVTVIADLRDIWSGYVGPHFDRKSGNLFVSSVGENEVLKVSSAGDISLFASTPAPADITSDATGNIYVGNWLPAGTISKITPDGSVVTRFATGLAWPDGLAFGPGGDLFIGDRGTQRIMRVPATGGAPAVFAYGFNNPLGVTFDSQGDLLVANFGNGNLSRVSPTGAVSEFGSRFGNPLGLAFDPSGNLYVADFGGGRILKIVAVSPPANQPPDISNPSPSIAEIWPPNNKMVEIAIQGVTDPDGDAVSIEITGISNDETGTDDADGVGSDTAQVRAARDGKGDGRTYTITFVATDANGASSEEGSVTVTVPHDQGKGEKKGRAKPVAGGETISWGAIKESVK